MPGQPPKLVLCVLDGLAPAQLERAVREERAPALAALMARGTYVPDCVAAFPSVTPVCASAITTGVWQDRHLVPSMNWYHRGEERYVEYGSSLRAAQRFGIARQLIDTVYNMNRAHLSPDTPTVFEALDDAGVRTAGTTYLIYRGRHRHEPVRDTALTRIATTLLRHPVMGPRELFYADIFASRRTGCRSMVGMPGMRDRHAGCVGSYLVEHDLFDFLLFSLPDNDWFSHKNGPAAQVESIAAADRQLMRLMDAAGGVDAFLDEHAVIVMADHSHTLVERSVNLQTLLSDFEVRPPTGPVPEHAQIAVCPAQRAAHVYILEPESRPALLPRIIERSLEIDGVDLVMWRSEGEGVIASVDRGQLRFTPGGDVPDRRGATWSVDGNLGVLGGELRDGVLHTPDYPDGLARVWAALTCPTAGDVALSSAGGYEFVDWGGAAHVRAGSHGSLHADDSLGALVMYGLDDPAPPGGEQWAIRDIAPLVTAHFGAGAARPPGRTEAGQT